MNQEINEEHRVDFDGKPYGGTTNGLGLHIEWQSGPPGDHPNGAFVETVVEAALGRLLWFQKNGVFSNEYATAIDHLNSALYILTGKTAPAKPEGATEP